VQLTQAEAYARKGLSSDAISRLSLLGDLLLTAGFNVTGIRDPEAIERLHFLDCLALLDVPVVASGRRLVDLGSGAGLPALVLGLALPSAKITAIESHQKKCRFIEASAGALGLENVDVRCARAEDYGRDAGRERHDVVVSRAVASLAVIVEYSLPLLSQGGAMVAMKGLISNEERIQAENALAILGGKELESVKLEPFQGADNRWVYLARKVERTPSTFPRRTGVAVRKPLGQ
jgi:16S rRNA (guanine527-N7)-methyltransferase